MVIEWKGIFLILAIVFIALILVKLVEKKSNINAEIKRKLFHMSMGLTMLILPYIFKSWISVGVLGIISFIVMLILKNTKLKQSLGTVLYSVDRESLGEIFFIISVVWIFYLSKGNKILFSIPILILTFADSTAALIGKSYGKNNIAQYNEDAKSIEGSFMFFIVAFMSTLVPILLFTEVGREETLIISTIVGINVALIEMISHTGHDNLLIPLTTFAFIANLINKHVQALRTNLIVLGIIYILITIANRVKAWSKLAIVEAFVVGYLTMVLYGFYAMFPPIMTVLTIMRFPKRRENEKDNIYDARIIETNVIIPIAICGIVAITGWHKQLFMTYATCYAMQLIINTFVRFKYYIKLSEIDCILLAICKGIAFVFIPSLIIQYLVFGEFIDILSLITMVLAMISSAIIIYVKKKNVKIEEITINNGYMHAKIVFVLALIIISQQILNLNGIIATI